MSTNAPKTAASADASRASAAGAKPAEAAVTPFATGAWIGAVIIDAAFGLFYGLGGLALLAAGSQIASNAEEAATNLHTGLIYLPVGLALIGAAVVLIMRRSWSYAPGVWLNSLGVVTAIFMFFRAVILRAIGPVAEGAVAPPPVTVGMLSVLVVQTALFSLAIRNCMRLQRAALEAVAHAVAAQTAPDDNILPPVRRGKP